MFIISRKKLNDNRPGVSYNQMHVRQPMPTERTAGREQERPGASLTAYNPKPELQP